MCDTVASMRNLAGNLQIDIKYTLYNITLDICAYADGDEIFRTSPDLPWGPPSPLYNGYRVFPGGKVRQERAADL